VVSFTLLPLYPQRKEPQYQLDTRLGVPQCRSDSTEKWKFLTIQGLKLQNLGGPARSPSLYRLRYSSSQREQYWRFCTYFALVVCGCRSVDRLNINSEAWNTIQCIKAESTSTHDVSMSLRLQACTFEWWMREREEISVENGPLSFLSHFPYFLTCHAILLLTSLLLNKGSCPRIQSSVTALH
jgi:hypothetical protein